MEKEILSKYQRFEHLRRFVWDLKPFKHSPYGNLQEEKILLVNEIIPNDIDFYSLVYCGLSFKCIGYNNFNGNIQVAIMNALLPSNEDVNAVQLSTTSKFPLPSVREAIANSLIHQDLYITGTAPVVEIFENRIEVTNPGTPLVDVL